MAQPTQAELEARRDDIDDQLERLIKLPAKYSVGNATVDNLKLIETLRIERDHLERAIRSLEYGYNSMQGPELEVL